ncbi:hypothetical protein DES53_109254 [Roseimicrobium gellanilyticum]|uniref:Uncharacterized protein n=1 Tax=Roseimicrobium gellanilyticum TaxID=748857 RepID=A0A366HBY8_9BACT|nr:hypothetical protein DES53_109254 [Roseimicrobium gellanilyticum]
METLVGLLAVFGLIAASLWFLYRYVAPRLARQDSSQSRFKRSNHDSGGSDEIGHSHSQSHDSGDDGGGDGGD